MRDSARILRPGDYLSYSPQSGVEWPAKVLEYPEGCNAESFKGSGEVFIEYVTDIKGRDGQPLRLKGFVWEGRLRFTDRERAAEIIMKRLAERGWSFE